MDMDYMTLKAVSYTHLIHFPDYDEQISGEILRGH